MNIVTVGDLKKHLEQFPDHLPVFISARESLSCCGADSCECDQQHEEYEIIKGSVLPAEKKPKRWWQKDRYVICPERVVIELCD